MKRNTCIALVLLAAPLVWDGAEAYARTWTDTSGKYTIEADLVDCRDGVVRLKKPDGQVISFPLSKLSAADRALIEGQSTAPEASAGQVAAAEGGSDAVLIELLTGAKSQGQLVARDAESISIRVSIAGRSLLRKYPLERVHAITIGGRREVLREMPSAEATSRPRTKTPSNEGTAAAGAAQRTRAEVEAMIDKLGRTPPDWFDSEPLDYPQSLDLNWPEKPPGDWNSQRNMGQYIWDVINPNPGKWRSGVRLMHHLLTVHKDNPQLQVRIIDSLARMYQFLLEDYARAAFWWRKSGADRDTQSPRGINLAACYWKLGNKQMAVDLLNRLPVYYSAIKLWADMGETRRALQYAEAGAQGDTADMAYLCAGDACRVAGQHQQALGYYEKVLGVRATGNAAQRVERSRQRAQANIEGIKLFDTLDLRRVPDGSYQAQSPGYAGPVHIEVAVRGGRIESVKVTQHQEKQFYSAIAEVPRKIVEKQGLKGIDATSSATITSEAIINATAKALSGGMK